MNELDKKLLIKKYGSLDKIQKKLDNHYPIQYLIGNVEFYGYPIEVREGVLIPRFETEELVSRTIKLIKKHGFEDACVLDIGTGTGCIPIALKKELPELKVSSIDINGKAIRLANKNARINKVDVTFIKKSIYKYNPINKYSVIISNPPYVDKDEEVGPEIKYEPKNAIFAKEEGLEFYKYIIKNSSKYLEDEFLMAFEIGYQQGKFLKEYAKEIFPEAKITVEKDLAGFDRFLFIEK